MAKTNHALATGVFLFSLVAITVASIIWLGRFQEQRNLYFVATQASVAGLNPETTVYFRGIAVGKVISIQFDPNDSNIIVIPIEVDKDITLTRGVYGVLQLKGVTGLTQLQLLDAGGVRELLPPGNDKPEYRIPIRPSKTDQLLDAGEEILRKTDIFMVRLNNVLSDENQKHISEILSGMRDLTGKLNELEKSIDKALLEVPGLSRDAHRTLANINELTGDLRGLTTHVKRLNDEAKELVKGGTVAGHVLLSTTLPRLNQLLGDLQSTSSQIKRTAKVFEQDPQALLFGADVSKVPAPGEPNFQE